MSDDPFLVALETQLTARLWPTRRIRAAVGEARRHLADSNEVAADVFGDPGVYAAALDEAWSRRDPPFPRRLVGNWLCWFGGAAFAVVVLRGVGRLIGSDFFDEEGWTFGLMIATFFSYWQVAPRPSGRQARHVLIAVLIMFGVGLSASLAARGYRAFGWPTLGLGSPPGLGVGLGLSVLAFSLGSWLQRYWRA